MKPPIDLPLPIGWFCLAGSADVPPGAVQEVAFMGHALVLFRGTSGALGLLDAYCPHLGANIGRGGRVEGDTVRCPFHGFRFEPSGACAAAYGVGAPKKLRTRAWPVREKHGLVLAWYHPEAREPDWEVPDLDVEGYSPLLIHRFSLRGHPQETSENSVDIGHFGAVHGNTDVVATDTRERGAQLALDLRFRWSPMGVGKLGLSLPVEAHVEVHGLGYSFVDTRVPDLGMHIRYFVLSTPTQEDHIDLRLATMTEDLRRAPKVGRFLPGFATDLVARLTFSAYKREVGQDFDIWKNKRYVHPPILAHGDGPIMRYRAWAAQFYPSAEAAHEKKRALPVASS